MTSVSTTVTSGLATTLGTPQPWTTGMMYGASDEAPNDADRKPESVTPICTVDRKVLVAGDFGDAGSSRVGLFHLLDL